MTRSWTLAAALGGWLVALAAATAVAGKRAPAPVPAGLEIEVLDPGVDSQGHPAVVLQPDGLGGMQVDIPPVVLVHRYYYSGDRSFQGPMLPGGPSILVVHHPKTGERCYVPAQMMPGAPRVTYTGSGIDYDYGAHRITLAFPLIGKPKVKYTSGTPLPEKVAELVHAEQLQAGTQQVAGGARRLAGASRDSLKAAAVGAKGLAQTAALPVANLIRLMPLGTALLDPDRALIRDAKLAEHQRQHEAHLLESKARRDEQTISTVR